MRAATVASSLLGRIAVAIPCILLVAATPAGAARVTLQVLDRDTGQPLACRVYLQDANGGWHFLESAVDAGDAVVYQKQRSPDSVEMHTSLSANPAVAELASGSYTLTVERGKEYVPHVQEVRVNDGDLEITVHLQRWIDMSAHGWYSGETHVHRTLEELPTAMLAEDLNVAFPLTYWVTRSHTPPAQGDKNLPDGGGAELIRVDDTHVIWPRNTEYEIFSVGGTRHTLGAVFALNHQTVFDRGVPPVKPIADQVHREGGLLELDKHNWPWSMAIIPVMDVDLYELTNNHIWRTEFYFKQFGVAPAPYMEIERDDAGGMTERGWIDFTLQNYYALLNSGFRMRPTAGTASGVHPVPLGFGRVYVHLPDGFDYDAWLEGLDEGRSVVTTGPMLVAEFDVLPGGGSTTGRRVAVRGWAAAPASEVTLELVVNGETQPIAAVLLDASDDRNASRWEFETIAELDRSSWLAVRCFTETEEGRPRFAHSAPHFVDIAGRPPHPRRVEVEYLVERVENEIERNRGILTPDELAEFREALRVYRNLLEGLPDDRDP